MFYLLSTERLDVSIGAGAMGRCLCRGVLDNGQAVLRVRNRGARELPKTATGLRSSSHVARQQGRPRAPPRGELSSIWKELYVTTLTFQTVSLQNPLPSPY
jgi:hypothetical protein